MTSLADKVARVKEWNAGDYHELDNCYEAVALIAELWDENQKQREVLGMAREALLDVLGAAMFDRPEIHRRIGKEALTAIDNVMKGEGV